MTDLARAAEQVAEPDAAFRYAILTSGSTIGVGHDWSVLGLPTGSDAEDQLALEVSAVEQPVRVGDALERERLLHVGAEPALFDEFDETS